MLLEGKDYGQLQIDDVELCSCWKLPAVWLPNYHSYEPGIWLCGALHQHQLRVGQLTTASITPNFFSLAILPFTIFHHCYKYTDSKIKNGARTRIQPSMLHDSPNRRKRVSRKGEIRDHWRTKNLCASSNLKSTNNPITVIPTNISPKRCHGSPLSHKSPPRRLRYLGILPPSNPRRRYPCHI